MVLDVIKTFKKAESLENLRTKTYQKYLKKVDFPAGKKILSFLVNTEKKHLKFLTQQVKRLNMGKKVAFSKLKSPVLRFDSKEKLLKKSMEGIANDIGILRSAAELEKYDALFYKKAYQSTKDISSKYLFRKMQAIENEHLDLINKTIIKVLMERRALGSKDSKALFYGRVKR